MYLEISPAPIPIIISLLIKIFLKKFIAYKGQTTTKFDFLKRFSNSFFNEITLGIYGVQIRL